MNKSKLTVTVLAVALIISVVANTLFVTGVFTAGTGSSAQTKVDMTSVLFQVQTSANAELKLIGNSLTYASEQLTTSGLTGTQADAILSALAANSSLIIDAGTQDMNNIMVAVQPSTYSSSIGVDVGEQKWLNTNPAGAITPSLTPIIPLIENMTGVAMAAPVFNSNKEMIGTVSVIFNPEQLLSTAISEVTTDPQYEFTVLQLDGTMLFDSMGSSMGENFFSETTNEDILMTGYQIIQIESGYTTYNISANVEKQCYWTTIAQYGQEWRLLIHHAI